MQINRVQIAIISNLKEHILGQIKYFFVLLFFINNRVEGQVDTKQTVYALKAHTGFVLPHSIYTQNTKGARPFGFEADISCFDTSQQVYNTYHCFPRSGISINYADMDYGLLGKSYSAAYFLEPNFRLNNRAALQVKGSIGLSYLTNPFDSIKNPENQNYSLAISAFLQVGVGLSYNVSPHTSLQLSGNWYHNSNGGFKQPNRGLNYPNLSFGVLYFKEQNSLPIYNQVQDTSWKELPVSIEGGLFISPKGGYNKNVEQERNFLGGLYLQAGKQIASIHKLTAGAEIYFDGGMQSIKRNLINDSSSNILAGVLIGHEFLINRFSFSQQLGFYLFKETDYYNQVYADIYKTIYHRWGIKYQLKPHWAIGINLLVHNQVADFIDARFFYKL